MAKTRKQPDFTRELKAIIGQKTEDIQQMLESFGLHESGNIPPRAGNTRHYNKSQRKQKKR